MPTYHYTAFGLNIHSEISLPELLPGSDATADVTICLGKVPDQLSEDAFRHGIWQALSNQFLFNVKSVARFLIADGNKITIDVVPNKNKMDVRAFLFGSPLAALLQQREIFTLHASAIETPNGAVLFLGRSGSGKSTLLAALSQRGYAMMSDDVTGVELASDSNIPIALPAYPYSRLWADSAKQLSINIENALPVRSDMQKYHLNNPHFCNHRLPICAIYSLTSHNQTEIKLSPLDAIKRFRWLHQYTYRKRFLLGLQRQPYHLTAATAFARHVPMTQVTRPTNLFMLDKLVDCLEQDFQQHVNLRKKNSQLTSKKAVE